MLYEVLYCKKTMIDSGFFNHRLLDFCLALQCQIYFFRKKEKTAIASPRKNRPAGSGTE